MSKFFSMFAIVAAAVGLTACGQGTNQPAEGDAAPDYITIQGSDTMNVMVTNWAEAFMDANPGLEIAVTGGGSGTGIAALKNGTTDLCMASRPIRETEIASITEATGMAPVEHTVAMDGIAVVVNPANPVDALSLADLEAIYTGTIRNWSELGGEDLEIVVVSRDSSSGTYAFFQTNVLNKKDYYVEALLLPANAAIVGQVATTPGAIGYVGLGYANGDNLKTLKVKADEAAEPVMPTIETIRSGDYPIARGLFLYTKGEGSPLARQFIDFCLSPEGQAIVAELGEVPVR